MPGYVSNWQLTIDPSGTPRVVVAFGAKITGELEVGWKQQVQQAPAMRRGAMKNHGRKNVSRDLTIGVYKDHASDAVARNWMWDLDTAADAYSGVTVDLLLEIQGGESYTMAEAVVDDVSTRLVDAGVARTLTTWRFLRGPAVVVP